MRHKACIHIFICASCDDLQLPATAFLSWRSQQKGSAWDGALFHDRDDPKKGSNRSSSYEVVPAGVANAGEGIILRVEDDDSPFRPVLGGERSFEAVSVRCHIQTLCTEECYDAIVGLEFFVAELWVFMDLGGISSGQMLGRWVLPGG